jgi:hypothetical protein
LTLHEFRASTGVFGALRTFSLAPPPPPEYFLKLIKIHYNKNSEFIISDLVCMIKENNILNVVLFSVLPV